MRHLRTVTALAATASMALVAAPGALANTAGVGNSSDTPTMNICVASQMCTYVNYKNGKPTDVVGHSGHIRDWSVNAGSIGGQVQLRVLRPIAGGKFTAARSSSVHTISTIGLNKFSANLAVKRGDVLALSNATSGIYMAVAPSGTCVRYFSSSLSDGTSGKPDQNTPELHLLLSAHVKF